MIYLGTYCNSKYQQEGNVESIQVKPTLYNFKNLNTILLSKIIPCCNLHLYSRKVQTIQNGLSLIGSYTARTCNVCKWFANCYVHLYRTILVVQQLCRVKWPLTYVEAYMYYLHTTAVKQLFNQCGLSVKYENVIKCTFPPKWAKCLL